MVDRLSPLHRSWNMSRIKGKNTKPEMKLRSLLRNAGRGYRLHGKGLPGKPDVVLTRYRTAIFVNGCYWHRHSKCSLAYTPKSNLDFWLPKFAATVERDKRRIRELEARGWNVITVWQCELERDPAGVIASIERQLHEAA